MSNPPSKTLDEEVREKVEDRKAYVGVIERLSKASVDKHWDAYSDIPWDDPDLQVDPDDPRWALPELDPLAQTEWYRTQPQHVRSRIGLWRVATHMKIGLQFENLLKRGLLTYAYKLPNGSPEFRYCLHEMSEECNHIQMFQELVDRTGVDVPGMKAPYRATSPFWHLAAYAPVIFFIGILAGEEPIDHFQKDVIRDGAARPPALLRTMEIHIAEEARHISFAHRFLNEHVARQTKAGKGVTSIAYPLVMRWLAGAIMAIEQSIVMGVALAYLFVRALGEAERAQEREDRYLDAAEGNV